MRGWTAIVRSWPSHNGRQIDLGPAHILGTGVGRCATAQEKPSHGGGVPVLGNRTEHCLWFTHTGYHMFHALALAWDGDAWSTAEEGPIPYPLPRLSCWAAPSRWGAPPPLHQPPVDQRLRPPPDHHRIPLYPLQCPHRHQCGPAFLLKQYVLRCYGWRLALPPPPPPLREQRPCQSNSRCCFRNFWNGVLLCPL